MLLSILWSKFELISLQRGLSLSSRKASSSTLCPYRCGTGPTLDCKHIFVTVCLQWACKPQPNFYRWLKMNFLNALKTSIK